MNQKIVYRKRSSMFVRPNTSDDLVVDEAEDYSGLFINATKDDSFMDIGSNIGGVIRYATDNTEILYWNIIGYEPDINNYNVAMLNCCIGTIFNKAISNNNKTIKLYIPKGSNKGKISTIKRNKDNTMIKVKSLSFKKELKKHKPTLIKMDIEGGEYNINLSSLPNYITGFSIEIHKIDNNWKNMKKLYKKLHKQFSYELGDIPKDNDWYKERDCFMTIFLRNKK